MILPSEHEMALTVLTDALPPFCAASGATKKKIKKKRTN
jgi:hypothetical protein